MFGLKHIFLLSCLAISALCSADSHHGHHDCPSLEWLGYHGHCYRHFAFKLSRDNALAFCRDKDADLASIHSKGENNVINGLVGGAQVSSRHTKGCFMCLKVGGNLPLRRRKNTQNTLFYGPYLAHQSTRLF